MPLEEYTPPLDRLLALGRGPTREAKWPDYLQYGFTSEHVPELIRMVTDPAFNNLTSECREVWAPLHAWRTLAQLEAVEAVEPLLSLLRQIDEADDDWVGEELPEVLGILGPAAIPAVANYLADSEHGLWARIAASRSLGEIGQRHPEARDECVVVLTRVLERFADHDAILNAFIISDLLALQAREALPVIRNAYQSGRVDCSIQGDFQDLEITLGTRQERSSAPRYLPPPTQSQDLLAAVERMAALQKGAIPAMQTPNADWLRTGRNDSCPCGSGLKFKKCCLPRVQETRR